MEIQIQCSCRVLASVLRLLLPLVVVYGSAGNQTDQFALMELKAALYDPGGALASWNTTNYFCNWYGVTCGSRHQRVTALTLHSLNLGGIISPSIGNLSFLRILDLSNNSLHSNIPPEVGHLSRLQVLSLVNNSLDGQIPPHISRFSDLETIDLRNNMLVGNLPSNFSSFSKLKYVGFAKNNLTGPILDSYGNLSSLEYLSLSLNSLQGTIPESLGNLVNLQFLSLGDINLVGTIPSGIFNISSLKLLDVSLNQLVGSMPSDLGDTLPALQRLYLNYNHFTGPIPTSLSNLSNLLLFQTYSNNFSGGVPSFLKMRDIYRVAIGYNPLGSRQAGDLDFLCSLTNSTGLRYLQFDNNNFGGSIPECISNLSMTLENFWGSENFLHGSLPSGIGNLINLNGLYLHTNNFSGNIPSEIGNLVSLTQLSLGWNAFSGQIPESIGNLSMLTHLSVRSNGLQGTIPSTLSKCQNLLLIDLGDNRMTGVLPSEVISISSLSIYADFSMNNLTGNIPVEVGNLKNLGMLNLADNRFSGEIPSSLGSCLMLESLYMQDNLLEGSVPSTLSSLKGLQQVNLSNNKLSGEIPNFLKELNLTTLDLSYNEFDGAVPTEGVFRNASGTSVTGNKNFCGGLVDYHLPKCNNEGSRKAGTMKTTKLVIICTILGFTGLVLVVASVWLYISRRRQKSTEALELSMDGLLKVSYQSLLKATDGFSSENLIGSGSFGSVFRGVLDSNQTVVAVKVLTLARYGAAKSFDAECEALRNIRHRNLVKIITACSGTDYQGNDFKALVYEFMGNGSLDSWLHSAAETTGKESAPASTTTARQLNLLHRLSIAIDVAAALDYLHNQCDTQIIHCDLKPSNILLDNEMTARVGDFGLVRFCPEATRELVADLRSSIGVKGSIGYIAPEYGAGGEVSAHGDIYSYGILILEIFTGKRPTDEMFTDGLNLHSFAKGALTEGVSRVIDPVLLEEYRGSETDQDKARARRHGNKFQKVQECLLSVIRLGVVCSSESPGDRINIVQVYAALQVIQKELLQALNRGE